MSQLIWTRRRFVIHSALSFGALGLAGCDRLGQSPAVKAQF